MRRQREDQIERNVVDSAPPEGVNRPRDLRGVVGSVHPFERGIIEALRAQRNTVDAGRDPVRNRHVVHVVGVRFDGYLGGVRELRAIPDARKDVPYSMSSEARWRSATKIDRVEGGSFQVRTQTVQLAPQGR